MRWLTVRELGGRAPYAYATGETGQGIAVGLLPIYNYISSNPRYQLNHILRGMPSSPLLASSYFGGALSGYQTDLPTVSSSSVNTATKALLASALHMIGKSETLIIPYITTRAADAIVNIPSAHILLEGVDAWLDVPTSPFDEYVESLRAEPRRLIRRDIAAFRQAKLTADIVPLRGCISTFAPLTVQNSVKYGLKATEKYVADYLNIIAEVFGDDSVVFLAKDGSRLVGGALGLIHEGILYLREVGFDYSAITGSHAYFVLYFHYPMTFAANTSLTRIHLGLSVDRTKRSRGGRLQPLWTALVNAKLSENTIDTLNSNRLSALSEVIGPSQRSNFISQARWITESS